MRPLHENIACRLLNKLAGALHDHPRWFLWPQILLAVACIVFTVLNLKFSTDRNDLVSTDEKNHLNVVRLKQDFKVHDSMVAIVESDDREKNRLFVERLAVRLQSETNLFTDIYYKGDLKLMGNKALLFLPEETLVELNETLRTNQPVIRAFSEVNNLNALFELVNRRMRALPTMPAESVSPDSLGRALPTLERVVNLATESVSRSAALPAPGIAALFDAEQNADHQDLYITFGSGRIYVVTAQAANAKVEAAAIIRLRELVTETQSEVAGVNTGVTGEPVLKYDEMRQARYDTDVAALISLVLSAVIFIFGYNEFRRPMMATFCLMIGISYTLGFATLVVGRLNILSITLVPILIGLAIDFGVHLIARYEEELRLGATQPTAVRKAIAFTGIGIFSSGFTTAGAFFAMMLTDFKGIREMGLISGVGLLLCMVPMMTVLPLLLVRGKRQVHVEKVEAPRRSKRERIEQVYLQRPWLVLFCGGLFTIFAISQFPKIHFDYNLLNLQTRDLPAVGMEKKLIESGSQSLLYGVVVASSLPHAEELERKIRALPSVSKVVSMAEFLNSDQQKKLALIGEIKSYVSAIRLPALDRQPVDFLRLSQTLYSLQGYLGLAEQIPETAANKVLKAQARSLWESVGRLRTTIAADNPLALQRLTAFQQGLFTDLQETVEIIRQQDDRAPLQVADIPPFLRDHFISPSGKFLLQVYPKEDVWQRAKQEVFIRELRTIDPDVTGSPVQFYEYTSMLKEGFQKAAAYAGMVIAVLVYLHFRRFGSVLLAFLPVGLGACWTLGLMGLFNVPFNPVNIMALTLFIGIGVTNGIHILNRFAEEAHPSLLARSTGKAVLVSGMTTIAGFGSLIVAKHQGIASLGTVMSMGTGMCMLASLAFLPAVLHLLNRVGWTMIKTRRSWRRWLGRKKKEHAQVS